MIYFVQAGESDPIKIGTTIRLTVRLGTLQREEGVVLHVLGVMPGGQPQEAALHRRFRRHRVHGEWFCPSEPILRFIRKKAKPWDGKDEIPLRQGRKLVTVELPVALARALEERCRQEMRTKKAVLTFALTEFLAQHGYWPPPDPG